MGLVARAALASLGLVAAACYDPEVRDCTVTCDGPGECAAGQVCGDDGWCASPSVAGQCGEPAPSASLRIVLTGQGRVKVMTLDVVCAAESAAGAACTYPLAAPIAVAMKAENAGDWRFRGWATANCEGQGDTCELAATAGANLVEARFEEGD